tara:strand:+ start:124 stop:342 length:219 start_codon:yes stop_codon:yes gene_type:complete
MSQVKKIEEMIEEVEKKVHAGEWIRVDVVRTLMSKFAIWMNGEFKKDLIDLRDAQLAGMEEVFNATKGDEEE